MGARYEMAEKRPRHMNWDRFTPTARVQLAAKAPMAAALHL